MFFVCFVVIDFLYIYLNLPSDNPKTLEFIVQEDRNLDVALPIPASKVSITLKDPSGAEHNLYKSGRGVLETLNLFEGRFSLQNHLSGSILQIHDLKPGDAGTYEVRDSKGLLIVSVLVISDITGEALELTSQAEIV